MCNISVIFLFQGCVWFYLKLWVWHTTSTTTSWMLIWAGVCTSVCTRWSNSAKTCLGGCFLSSKNMKHNLTKSCIGPAALICATCMPVQSSTPWMIGMLFLNMLICLHQQVNEWDVKVVTFEMNPLITNRHCILLIEALIEILAFLGSLLSSCSLLLWFIPSIVQIDQQKQHQLTNSSIQARSERSITWAQARATITYTA